MTIRFWKWAWQVGRYMKVEIGTKAGHKIIVRCRDFQWIAGEKYSFSGMPPLSGFAIELENIEYMRRVD